MYANTNFMGNNHEVKKKTFPLVSDIDVEKNRILM